MNGSSFGITVRGDARLARTARRIAAWAAGAVVVASTSGCYKLQPLNAAPVPGTMAQLELSDEGRFRMAAVLGPDVEMVRGEILRATTDSLVIATRVVETVRGSISDWTGEPVGIPRAYIGRSYARSLDKPKSAIAAAAVFAAFGATVGTRGFGVFGGDPTPTQGGSGGPAPGN
jgi:hypothetical protein